jgi:hypothetical protein
MSISPTTSSIVEPIAGERVPVRTLAYFRARLRNRLHSTLLRIFKSSGITKAELAARIGRDAAQVNRWLGAPGNMTLDTLSDLLFAIDGSELVADVRRPLQEAPRNYAGPYAVGGTPEFGLPKTHTFQRPKSFEKNAA